MEYSEDVQKLLLEFLIADNECYVRCQPILKAEYFDAPLRQTVKYIKDYAEQYRVVPTADHIKAHTGIRLNPPSQPDERHVKEFLDTIERFCRHKAVEMAVYGGADLLPQGRYDEIEANMREAVLVSLQHDLGIDYFADPRGRAELLRNRNRIVSTGWATIDEKLYGGFNRGELNIFAGNSGAGKSLFLLNVTRNWSRVGLKVVYLTLELSELLVSQRLDAMNSGFSTREIYSHIDEVELKIKMLAKSYGNLTVRYMPSGITTNDIRSYLKTYKIQTGHQPDALVLDYLDLMSPNSRHIDPSNLFVKDKYVSEEFRSFLQEEELLSATASQLNRSAANQNEGASHDHSHISGGISKINTADNVISIWTTDKYRDEKPIGRIRAQFLKTRSSAGVGYKVWLGYHADTMEIVDLDEQPHHDDSPDDNALMNLQKMRQNLRQRTSSNTHNGQDASKTAALVHNLIDQANR